MSEKIIAEYELKTGQFKASVNSIIGDLNKIDAVSGKANAEVQQDFKKTAASIDRAGKEADQLGKKVQMSGSKLSTNAKSIGTQFQSIAAAASSMGAAIGIAFGVETVISFAKESVAAATALGEVETKTEAIFGGSKNLIDDFAKNAAQSIGQSELAAKNAASTFGIFGKSAGLTGDELAKFSIANTGLASDLASFFDSTPEEAILAIGAALRGENEPIRRYGVLLDDATLRQKALEMGLVKTTKEALTPQNKVLAANAVIWEQTRLAQGDFLKTSDSLANQQRILTANITNLKAALGNELLPTVNALVGGFNDLFTGSFESASEKFLKFGNDVDVLGINPIVNMANAISNVRKAFMNFFDGNFSEGLEDLARGFIDILTYANPLIGVYDTIAEKTGIYENLGLFNTEATEAAQSAFLLETRMKLFNSAVEKGGEELDLFYENLQRLAAAKGVDVTREKFDQYVKVQRAKLQLDKEENEELPKKISYYEALNKELKALTESTINIIAKGGIVPQRDIDRINALEKKLKETKIILDGLKEGVGESTIIPEDLEISTSGVDAFLAAEQAKRDASDETLLWITENLKKQTEATLIATDEEIKARQLQAQIEAELNQKKLDAGFAVAEGTLSAFRDVFNALGKENAEFAAFQKVLAIFDVSLKAAQAIAGATAAASAGDPYTVAIRIAAAVAAVGAAIGTAISTINSQSAPNAPQFAQGTPFVKRGNNKPGVDTIPAWLNEGEAVIPTDKNAKYPGMAQAWIAGKLDDYLIKNFVAPQIIKQQEKRAEKERERMAAAIFGTGTGFDDLRLYMATQKGNKYLEGIYMNTKRQNKKRQIQ